MNVDVSTIKRRLIAANLFGRVAASKPLVSPKNRKLRLQFAKRYLNWTSEDWGKIVWSDESPFYLFSSKGRIYIRFVKKYLFPLRHL